mmetsp:Transcript_14150/g.59130  ORF Transcript_14150/g.59130 Transcript_14150/m.59130 type:complete len:222 (-) Transcript_14150:351-1016(-)
MLRAGRRQSRRPGGAAATEALRAVRRRSEHDARGLRQGAGGRAMLGRRHRAQGQLRSAALDARRRECAARHAACNRAARGGALARRWHHGILHVQPQPHRGRGGRRRGASPRAWRGQGRGVARACRRWFRSTAGPHDLACGGPRHRRRRGGGEPQVVRDPRGRQGCGHAPGASALHVRAGQAQRWHAHAAATMLAHRAPRQQLGRLLRGRAEESRRVAAGR